MKKLLLSVLFYLPLVIWAQSFYGFNLDSTGVTYGKIYPEKGTFTRLSKPICDKISLVTYNPINSTFLLKGKRSSTELNSNLITIKASSGQELSSINLNETRSEFLAFEFNAVDTSLYALNKDEFGVKLGKINLTDGRFVPVSNTICYQSFCTAINPVKGYFIFKGQVLPNSTNFKLYAVDIHTGNVINSVDVLGGDEGIKQIEFNPCDSLIYGLSKSVEGVKLGEINIQTGLFTPKSSLICTDSYWSTIDPIKGEFVFLGHQKDSTFNSLFLINLKTGLVKSSIQLNSQNAKLSNIKSIFQKCAIAKPPTTPPFVLSPNNDGVNDIFYPSEFVDVPNAILKVYNRWGSILYEQKKGEKGWDGKSKGELCPEGSYFWTITYKDSNGKDVSKTGYLTLVR
ncbi:MAG: gliding motility-associated C-terminal domain-containing protein [Bacteroidota bacterium]